MFHLVSAICLLNRIHTADQTRRVRFQMSGDVENLELSNPSGNRTLTFSPEGNNTVITAYENGRVVERVSVDQNASSERISQLATSMKNGSSAPETVEYISPIAINIDEGETPSAEKDKKDKKKDDKKVKTTNGVKTNMACVGLLCAVLYNLV